MTWHHVAALMLAVVLVAICGHSSVCSQNMGSVLQLATVIVAGVFGHAGSQRSQGVLKHRAPEGEVEKHEP